MLGKIKKLSSFFAVLAIAIVISISVYCVQNGGNKQESKNNINEHASTSYISSVCSIVQTGRAVIGTFIHDNKDEITAFSTFIIACFTLTLWWVTRKMWHVANGQLGEMKESLQLSRDIFIAEQRPWISHDISVNSGFKWDEQGGTITLKFELKNTGRTPALNVCISGHIYPLSGEFPDPIDEQKNISNRDRELQAKSRRLGFTVFPGDRFPVYCTVHLTPPDIQKWRDRFKKSNGVEATTITPVIVGCITYTMLSSEQPYHQTGFIYVLTARDQKNPQIELPPIATTRELDHSNLVLNSWFFGSGITD